MASPVSQAVAGTGLGLGSAALLGPLAPVFGLATTLLAKENKPSFFRAGSGALSAFKVALNDLSDRLRPRRSFFGGGPPGLGIGARHALSSAKDEAELSKLALGFGANPAEVKNLLFARNRTANAAELNRRLEAGEELLAPGPAVSAATARARDVFDVTPDTLAQTLGKRFGVDFEAPTPAAPASPRPTDPPKADDGGGFDFERILSTLGDLGAPSGAVAPSVNQPPLEVAPPAAPIPPLAIWGGLALLAVVLLRR